MRFLHVPKTGGTWATYAMAGAGVPALRPEPSSAHATLDESRDYSDRFTFAFIRHPLDYWRSYWAYRVRTGWDQDNPLDRAAGSRTFEEFIEGVIAYAPGAASAMFEQFVGLPGDEIDFIGRYEHLVDDVCLALRFGGESFDEPRLRSHPELNVNDYPSQGSRYPRSLARRLAAVEQRGIERFYPWEPIPPRLLAHNRSGRSNVQNGQNLAEATIQLRNARAELEQARRNLQISEIGRHRLQRELEITQNRSLRRRLQRTVAVRSRSRRVRSRLRRHSDHGHGSLPLRSG